MTIQIDLKARFINVVTAAAGSHEDASGQFFFLEELNDRQFWNIARIPSSVSDEAAVRDIMNFGWLRTVNAEGKRVYVQINSIHSSRDRNTIEQAVQKFMGMQDTTTQVPMENAVNVITSTTLTLETAKAQLIAVAESYLNTYTLSALCITRSHVLMDILKPYINDSLVQLEVVEATLNAFRENPALMNTGSVVKDGVVYPEIEDEAEYLKAMADMEASLEEVPADFLATMAFITGTMMSVYPAAQAA